MSTKTVVELDKVYKYLTKDPKYVNSVLDRKQLMLYISELPTYEVDSKYLVCKGDKEKDGKM